jgi:hypothetical protein
MQYGDRVGPDTQSETIKNATGQQFITAQWRISQDSWVGKSSTNANRVHNK